MYTVKTKTSFDSAHFLSGYDGKCSNIHGHAFRVEAEFYGETLHNGMVLDFSIIKAKLRELTEEFDHVLIYEQGTLKDETFIALNAEKFMLKEVSFRPTAENFAKYFYTQFAIEKYPVKSVTVYETENNSATYSEV